MNAISWFEIPTTNLERAERFYRTVLGQTLQRIPSDEMPMAIFPYEQGRGVGGCLVLAKPERTPSAQGTLVYFATKDLDGALGRVAGAGGSVVLPRTGIGEHGFIGLVRDTEGNVVGLHSENESKPQG